MAKKANVEKHSARAKKMSMRSLVERLGELRDQRLPLEEEEGALKSEFIQRYHADEKKRALRDGILYEAEYTEIEQWIIDQEECARKLSCTTMALPRRKTVQRKVEARRKSGTVLALPPQQKMAAG